MINLLITRLLKACPMCFGMGTRETPNGDTIACKNCKGKGLV